MTEPYFLPDSYRSRLEPKYFVDDGLDAVWQPDVYPEAAAIARRLGATRIVDVGCGTGAKLVALHPEFAVVGLDYGSNLAACRERHDVGEWIDADLDRADTLGVDSFEDSLIVCADVIEHLIHPERLLRLLRGALDAGARALLLSTPERELNDGSRPLGPPTNEAHVHEWTTAELERFLAAEGLRGHFGLTRSNDAMPYMHTILAVVPGDEEEQRRVVAEWWEERRKWERLAVEHDRLLAEKERMLQEFDQARLWLEEQRAVWQRTAEEALAAKVLAEERLAAYESELQQQQHQQQA